jgi:filamentous hemagglutinin family protein
MDKSTARSRHPDSMRRAFLWALLPTLVLFLIAPSVGDAQVTTSITSTAGTGNLGTTVTQSGNLYNITGGTRPGGVSGTNLFHSFGDFSVGAGDIGNFLNNTGLPTSNILGRVTGGNISNIYGTIQTTGFGTANVFLVNPSGIVFGPHGSVNVGGSVSFTTAQYLHLFDGVKSANFYANPANDGLANSVLAVAPVVDFGFLSPAAYGFLNQPDPNATITVQGSELSVLPGQSISFVGGKVVIQGTTIPDGTAQPAHLSAPNGIIQFATAASPGEFDVATLQPLPNVDGTAFTSFGSVSLAPASSIDVSGANTVWVKGGQLVLSVNDATLSTSESSAPSDTISLSPGSSIVTSNSGADPRADVQLIASNVQLDGASLLTKTLGAAPAGNITLNVGTLTLTASNSTISSRSTLTDPTAGNAGSITIQGITGVGSSATRVSLDGGTSTSFSFETCCSFISTQIAGGSKATPPGAITITAQTLDLNNHAHIEANTTGAAPAGDITLNVDTLTAGNITDYISALAAGISTISSNSSFTDSTAGNAGDITIQGITGSGSPASNVSLDNNSTIRTEILGGSAFNTPGTITITAQTLALANESATRSDTFGAASPGDITLNVGTLTASNSSVIGSRAFFGGVSAAGNAGNITIQGVTGSGSQAANVSLDASEIANDISGGSAATPPGAITITAQTLDLNNHAGIAADTFGAAPAGDITLNVGTLTVGDSLISSRTFVLDQLVAGNAGNITIQGITGAGSPAANVSLDNSAILTEIVLASAASTPAAITITAQTLALAGTQIGAQTFGAAAAGDITLNVGTLTAGNSTISSSSPFADSTAGNAGSITIQGITGSGSPASKVTLDNSTISTTIGGGTSSTTPATIDITAQTVNLTNGAQISADTNGAAPAGNIEIAAGSVKIEDQTTTVSAITRGTGNGGSVAVHGLSGESSLAREVTLSRGLISTSTQGVGRSGDISVRADSLTVRDNGRINSASNGANAIGDAGDISIVSKDLTLQDSSVISAQADGTGANAGNILIETERLMLGGLSVVSTTAAGETQFSEPGNPGTITITATESIQIVDSDISTLVFAGSDPARTQGSIILTSPDMLLVGGSIAADSGGAAPAGNITINVTNLTTLPARLIVFTGEGPRTGTVISSTSSRSDSVAGPAGQIRIQGLDGVASSAENINLTNAILRTTISGGADLTSPATIEITTNNIMLNNGSQIKADTSGAAPAGDITLNVGTLTAGSSSITSSSEFSDSTAGNAGNITIQGITGSGSPAAHVSFDNSLISTEIFGGSAATTPATITITAQTLALANGAAISASTVGRAPAGDIALNVGTLTVSYSPAGFGSSGIFSGSHLQDATAGNAGNITIQGITGSGSPAAHVSLDSGDINTAIFGGSAATTPATITITAQTLALANGGVIAASTGGTGPAGDITLNVGTLTADYLGDFDSGIFSRSLFTDPTAGNAGNITIQGITGSGSPAGNVHLDNSTISTTIAVAGGTSLSVPANITIAAQSVTLSNGGAITASTEGNAPAGNIGLVTPRLTMTPDSVITSNARTGGTGKAGSITITGAGSAPTTITGGTVQAQSETSASAGDITLQAPGDLTLLGTTVSVRNTGSGDAGSINLRVGNDLLVRNSQVSTESAEASGGNIKLTAPNLVRIVDSTLSSSVQGQAGSNGGNINIDPQWVVIQNSQLLANANAGAGGNITIAALGAVLIDPSSLLSASAGPAGVSGSVNIIAPIQVLGGILVPLNLAYSQAGLSGDRCAADPTGQFSSFVHTGRDGVPQVPGALSPSPLSFLETLTSGSLGSQSPN